MCCWTHSLFRGCWMCESVGALLKDIKPNWWAAFCRAFEHLRNILFILQQSGIRFSEWITCVIQRVLQVLEQHRVFINQTDTGINRKSWQHVVQEWDEALVFWAHCPAQSCIIIIKVSRLLLKCEGDSYFVLFEHKTFLICPLNVAGNPFSGLDFKLMLEIHFKSRITASTAYFDTKRWLSR